MGTKRESMASMKPDEGDVLAPPQSNLGLGEDDPIDDDVKECPFYGWRRWSSSKNRRGNAPVSGDCAGLGLGDASQCLGLGDALDRGEEGANGEDDDALHQ
ncbi:unnamed protein product [Ilex paraguariensis]|uniref:Uncharacterized protein n=1 Tax=Ilex paraguariensis TaxID=185542 RepID=A0ABC8QT62_9AQUA